MPVLRDKSKRNAIRIKLYEDLALQGMNISQTVKCLRKILGKSQVEFALQVGVSLATLRKIEQDSGNIELSSLVKILNRFDLELVVKLKSSGN